MSSRLKLETIEQMKELRKDGVSSSKISQKFGISTTTVKNYTKGIIPIQTKEKQKPKESCKFEEKFKRNIIKQQKVNLLCDKLSPNETFTIFERSGNGYVERKAKIVKKYQTYIDTIINGYRESILKADILTGQVVIKLQHSV